MVKLSAIRCLNIRTLAVGLSRLEKPRPILLITPQDGSVSDQKSLDVILDGLGSPDFLKGAFVVPLNDGPNAGLESPRLNVHSSVRPTVRRTQVF